MKKNNKLLITLGISLVACLALCLGLTGCGSDSGTDTASEPEVIINPLTGLESDEELPARPIVVSIDNVGDAVPQSNLSYADVIYEFPVEGLQTRLECMFYSEWPDFVGPVRSTRPYFIDMVREYKGAFVGYGWSPDAKRYLHKNYVPWINGMAHSELFYRVSDKASPHNAYIEWDSIVEHFDQYGMWDNKKNVKAFKFKSDTDEDSSEETTEATTAASSDSGDENTEETKEIIPEDAAEVAFDYTYAHCAFKYDEETGSYGRTVKGVDYVDKESGEQITCENILVQKVSSTVLDEKGRLEIDMTAGGEAMLFTGGTMIKGTWSRKDLDHRTIFKDENGNQFELTPGKTWVEVTDQNCTISY